jgi:hypothetical protein
LLYYHISAAAIVRLVLGCDSSSRNAGQPPADRQQAVISREPTLISGKPASGQRGDRTRAGQRTDGRAAHPLAEGSELAAGKQGAGLQREAEGVAGEGVVRWDQNLLGADTASDASEKEAMLAAGDPRFDAAVLVDMVTNADPVVVAWRVSDGTTVTKSDKPPTAVLDSSLQAFLFRLQAGAGDTSR